MPITGNKGEWSEIYTLFKLLGEGKIYAGDQCLNKIEDLFYPIIMILRQEKDGAFNYSLEGKDVVIQSPKGNELLRMPADVFAQEAEKLLIEIKGTSKGKGAFAIPNTEAFMNSVHCSSLKAKSTDKTDIRIVLHDCRTKMDSELGFSIKSQLGNGSTLLNASKATNFNFKIVGAEFTDDEISRINAIGGKEKDKKKVIKRVQAIKDKGATFVFDKVDNDTFRTNLAMLDGDLAVVLAHFLLEQFNCDSNMLRVMTERVAGINPLHYSLKHANTFYAYKIKHLLTSTALGMMPSKEWDGKFDANGGYIVVKSDGELLCYHFYDRNRFEDYLFYNAYLERSSTTRHEYASIIKENDGSLSFKLNLQIRFK